MIDAYLKICEAVKYVTPLVLLALHIRCVIHARRLREFEAAIDRHGRDICNTDRDLHCLDRRFKGYLISRAS